VRAFRSRYAHIEREQRWLADRVPPDAHPVASIVDRYIHGTRLRLRQSKNEDGVVYKLGQKVRNDPADPEIVNVTNLYLSVDEYGLLLRLPAAELRKTRSHVPWTGRTIAIDRFLGRHDGLIIAEVELAPHEPVLSRPPWAIRDVTHDDRFSGGALAFALQTAISELVRRSTPPA